MQRPEHLHAGRRRGNAGAEALARAKGEKGNMNRKPHQVTLSDFQSFSGWVSLALSAGKDSHKSLNARVTVEPLTTCYVVFSHTKIVYEGPSLADAICAYNAEP